MSQQISISAQVPQVRLFQRIVPEAHRSGAPPSTRLIRTPYFTISIPVLAQRARSLPPRVSSQREQGHT